MPRLDARRIATAFVLDLVAVLVFVSIGRRSHHEGSAIGGVLRTAAPFAVGLVAAWLAARAWRRPDSITTGLVVWPVTILVGMIVRRAFTDGGTAPSFVIVATVFLGACVLGWRQAVIEIARRRLRSSPTT